LLFFFRSQSSERKDNNSGRSFQDSTRSLNNSNFSSGNKRVSRDYVIDANDVPRLIGKGGGTIKQIQKENDVQIKVSNDRQSQWVDLIISGSNDQMINNAFNHIKNLIGIIKEKNESFQSKSLFKPGMLNFVIIYLLILLNICYRFRYE
jgi:predicted PilT family ATPase